MKNKLLYLMETLTFRLTHIANISAGCPVNKCSLLLSICTSVFLYATPIPRVQSSLGGHGHSG